MICTAHTCTAQLMLRYELCSSYFMLSLIPLLLHEADKPAFADVIYKICESGVLADIPDDGIQYVLDGGVYPMHGLTVLHMETSTTSTQNM